MVKYRFTILIGFVFSLGSRKCRENYFSLCVGVIAYVDVRSGKGRCENRSKAVAKQLDNLGATVSPISQAGVGALLCLTL